MRTLDSRKARRRRIRQQRRRSQKSVPLPVTAAALSMFLAQTMAREIDRWFREETARRMHELLDGKPQARAPVGIMSAEW